MKLSWPLNRLSVTPFQLLRSAGYSYIEVRKTGQGSFIRPLGRNNYPRFHIYIKEEGELMSINLHLDQKQVSYEGTAAHSGEYDGETVEAEIQRLKLIFERSSSDSLATKSRVSPLSPANQDERSQRWSNMLRRM